MSRPATTQQNTNDVVPGILQREGCDIASHPVINSDIKLPTPAIRRAYDAIANIALQRAPGCCFHAFPRFGKTSAIELLTAQLVEAFPDMPIFSVSAEWHGRFSELVYFGELLVACSHVMATAGKGEARRTRLLQYLWSQAKTRGSDRILFFIDEAQNWNEPELTTLRDVSNQLALRHGIKLIAVLFGAPGIVALRSSLILSGRIDLIGRFMVQQYEFKGVTSLDELILTMGYYDDAEVSEYPEGSKQSYSEFLLRKAYRSGWRLSQEAPRLWEQFRLAAQESGGLGQVGMQWVAESIRHFFVGQIEFDHPGLKGDPTVWNLAVKQSGFKDSLGVVYHA